MAQKIEELIKLPLKNDREIERVEIIMLKYKVPEVETKAVHNIIAHTDWPFKLVAFDNRPNPANMSKIWNKLIRESTCDYICIIDSDAFVPKLEPCWLTRLMETLKREKAGAVLPVTQIGGAGNPAQCVDGPKDLPPFNTDAPAAGFCFLFKKEIIQEIGWFDENYYIYGQDSDWFKRLLDVGYKIWIRPDVFVEHKTNTSIKKAEEEGLVDLEEDFEWRKKYWAKKYET